MSAPTRPYLFYDTAVSLCGTCFRRVDGKIVFEDERVYLLKRCPQHGFERALMADDVEYYRRCREVFLKPPGDAAALEHAGEVRVSVRLRTVSGP